MKTDSKPSLNRIFGINTRTGLMVLLITMSAALTACGGNKKEASAAPVGADITRPPQTIAGGPRPEVQERNPEETISFDEWRKRRLQELQEQQTP